MAGPIAAARRTAYLMAGDGGDKDGGAPKWVEWLMKDGKAAVAFVAVLIYGLARTATEAFYRRFGLSPEDVGISRTTTIAKAAVALVLFVSVVAAAVLLPLAAILRLTELRGAHTGDRHGHSAHQARRAPVAWLLLGVTATLPVALVLLSPEFLDFLLGYGSTGPTSNPTILRLAVGGWTATLCVLLYIALRASCPFWNRGLAPQPWTRWSALLFTPLVAILVSAIVHSHYRAGAVAAVQVVLLVAALLVPAVLTLLYGARLWQKQVPARSHGLTALASSLSFYVLLLPLTLAVVRPPYVQWLFPSDHDLFHGNDTVLSQRLGLLAHVLWIPAWLALVGLAALVAWRKGSCAGAHPLDPPRSEVLGLVGMVAFVSLVLLLLSDHRGQVMAERVQAGDRLRASGMVPVTAEPVCLTGKDGPANPGPYMYLGKAAGRLVVYDLDLNRTLFLVDGPTRLTVLAHDVFADDVLADDAPGRPSRADAAQECRGRALADTPPTTPTTTAKP